jgi:MoxR-like ATPase
VDEDAIDLINAALHLRRPLFVTGKPGTGKSSLADAIAHELQLGRVLRWPITTRVTLLDGLYRYDAIGRLQDARDALPQHASPEERAKPPDIGRYIRLGPLGTALLPWRRPRVLLIDEIDKSDIDLPNDLLNCFEEGEYIITELARAPEAAQDTLVMPFDGRSDRDRVHIRDGCVRYHAFPIVIITSNGEREFPPAFLRRCLRLDMPPPNKEKLERVVQAHLGSDALLRAEGLITDFLERQARGDLVATDQLLNAIYLTTQTGTESQNREHVIDAVLRSLSEQAME